MIFPEVFIMRLIPRSSWTIQHKYNSRCLSCITTNTWRCLNIFSCRFGLACDSHQPKSWNIKSNRNHIRSKTYINREFSGMNFPIITSFISKIQIRQTCSNLIPGNSTGQLFISPNISAPFSILLAIIYFVILSALVQNIQMLINISSYPRPCLV